MKKQSLPLVIFILLVIVLAVGLHLDPRKVPSPFIGKPAPGFRLPDLFQNDRFVSSDDFNGQVWLLSVWASWCGACRAEHPVINRLVSTHHVKIIGLDYKDNDDDARKWLQSLGNPYQTVVIDKRGMTGIDWGVYGVPETFVIGKKGRIRYKYIGPLSQDDIDNTLLPLLTQLEQEPS